MNRDITLACRGIGPEALAGCEDLPNLLLNILIMNLLEKKEEITDALETLREGFDANNALALAAQNEADASMELTKRSAKRIAVTEPDGEPVRKKKSHSEKGINPTLSSLQTLIIRLTTMGAAYVVNNALITLAALNAFYVMVQATVHDVVRLRTLNTKVLKGRYVLYMELLPFSTRVNNELKASGVSKETLERANSIIKKLRGQRVIALNPNETNGNRISACQTSYVNKLAHFGDLMALVLIEPLYDPVQDDLKHEALQARYDAMELANTDAKTTQSELDAAIATRNVLFNAEGSGLVDRALTTKNAVLAIFGSKSGEYKGVKGIPFDRIRN